MGYLNSYAYFLPIHSLYQIVSIKLCHDGGQEYNENKRIYRQPTERR